jgi:hypothetical protein
MSSAGQPPASRGPSVFISYASEDRAAARVLRDHLNAAGLEVWYDESELGGGDAWDQKIRRQIRDCDYFMPLVSEATERRKEGYFRREWRLAAERTMDMADDVLFLLPVALDGTSESGARVPERFLSVQWLRAPGGQSNPSLEALTRRLLAGEHQALPHGAAERAPLVPPVLPSRVATAAHGTGSASAPPAMPAFPAAPSGGSGHWIKFLAEILWWFVAVVWTVVIRLPRWVQVLLALFFLFSVFGQCSGNSSREKKKSPPAPEIPALNREVNKAIESAAQAATQAITEATNAAKDGGPVDYSKVGAEMNRRFNTKNSIDPNAAGKSLVIVPFTAADPQDAEAARLAASVFAACNEKLGALRPGEVAVTVVSVSSNTDEALIAVGRNLGARMILGARVISSEGKHSLSLRLVRILNPGPVWSAEYPLDGVDPAVVATKVIEGVTSALPTRRPGNPGNQGARRPE